MGGERANIDVFLDGKHFDDSDVQQVTVDRDMYQPDMALIVLSNQTDKQSGKQKLGQTIEVKIGKDDKSVFKGEIVGIEPLWAGKAKTTLALRCMNKMHRLLKGRKSKTFQDQSDQQIVSSIASAGGLTIEWTGQGPTYKHVYQHNQFDLEFIRTRVGRLGFHMWCVDTKLIVKKPDFGQSAKLKLSAVDSGALRRFAPRVNATNAVKKVTVKGWNPETKELITASESDPGSKLAKESAPASAKDLAADETFNVDTPVWSQEEAKAIAAGRLTEMNLTFVTADAECMGNADADLGQTVEVTASAKGDDPFNGNYYVMGLSHRYSAENKEGGFVTYLRLARDGMGKR